MGQILVAVPTYDGKPLWQTSMAVGEAKEQGKGGVDVRVEECSLLPWQFNRLWCHVLNDKRYLWFVMLHADIAPMQRNWLPLLIRQAEACGADVLSVISPVKTDDGLTSTALIREGEFSSFRRLTMREARQLPETFNRKAVAELFGWDWGESVLCANTGLMAVKMRRRDLLEQMHFHFTDGIRKNEQGQFEAWTQPEDWNWSMDAHALGLQVWVTRAVTLQHYGKQAFGNDSAWGTLEHDPGTAFTKRTVIRE